MPAHALLSLRSLKYGDEWEPVWSFLADRYDVAGPLETDAALDRLVVELTEQQSLLPGRVASTVYELMGEADQIGLSADQVARLAGIIEPDPERRIELLDKATAILGWDQSSIGEWGELMSPEPLADSDEATPRISPIGVLPEAPTVSLNQFTQALSEAGLLTTSPAPDAACKSSNVTGGSDGKATTVYGRFEIEAQLSALTYPTDPKNWPYCSWFFISMTPQGASSALVPPDAIGNTAYSQPLEELVGLDDVLTVRTGLTMRYFVGQNSVGMEFDLTPGTNGDGKIDVDHGYLLAEKHPTDPAKLIVTSQKTFSFVGLDDLPFSFLCEFGWIDMMRAMAQCRAPGGGTP